MLIVHSILAALAVGVVAQWPTRRSSAGVVGAAATIDVVLGAPITPAVEVAAPLLAFLAAALTLAALVERSGLAARAAVVLAVRGGGSMRALYALTCALCALLTATVSLDGAVVLMVPVLLVVARRCSTPLAPLFLGVVAVANAASIAVPQGNPTNLIVIDRLGLSPAAFLAHMLVPGLAVGLLCAGAIAVGHWRALAVRYEPPTAATTPLSRGERHAAAAFAVASLVAWATPLLGVAPWWPFAVVVAMALATYGGRPPIVVPWHVAIQVAGLVVVLGALAVSITPEGTLGLPALLAVAVVVGGAAAIANNLPVSASAATALAGPAAYATVVGLAIGSLATPHGSVATLIARQLAGDSAPAIRVRWFAPLAAAGLAVATVLVWAMR